MPIRCSVPGLLASPSVYVGRQFELRQLHVHGALLELAEPFRQVFRGELLFDVAQAIMRHRSDQHHQKLVAAVWQLGDLEAGLFGIPPFAVP